MDIFTSLSFWAFVLAALTLAATLIAPRLGRRAKLMANTRGIYPIQNKDFGEGIELKVFHNNNELSKGLYVISFEIYNSGSKDIVLENFIDPAKILLPEGSNIISHTYEAPSGIGESIGVHKNELSITWKLLKPREFIGISLVCQHDIADHKNRIDLANSIVEEVCYNIRLKDVDLFVRNQPGIIFKFAVIMNLLLFAAFSLFLLINHLDTKASVIHVNGEAMSGLLFLREGIALCELNSFLPTIRNCSSERFLIEDLRAGLTSQTENYYVGMNLTAVILISLVFIIYMIAVNIIFINKRSAQFMFTFYRLSGRTEATPFYFGKDKKQ